MNRHRIWAVMIVGVVGLVLLACSGAASAPAPTGAPFAGRPAAEDPAEVGDSGQPNQAPDTPDGQLIIYTGSLELEVAELDAAVSQAEQVVRGLGGHVASSQAEDAVDYQYATVTYRIPAERWSDALVGLHGLATRVLRETTSSDDVTAQVVDLDARLANLRVTEAALQAIMDRATTIDEVLKVQRELTSVRSDIESLTAQRDLLANRAALGTLEVTFGVPRDETSLASEGWDLGRELDSAVAALVRVAQGAASLLIWSVIVLLPIFLPIALVTYIAIRVRRRWQASHRGESSYGPLGGPPLGGPPAGGPSAPAERSV